MTMTIADALLPEFDQEMASTRRVLAVVPTADAAWKPHPKSFSLGDLALHLANLPRWVVMTLDRTELDLDGPEAARGGRRFDSVEALLEGFDRIVADARGALATATDGAMLAPWTLRAGGSAVFTLPRAAVLRTFVLSHMIHHRGQLSVYLRLRDVPLPPLYGPTADGAR
jgi:uncharacterized damage-inducible protein DinB